MKLFTKKEVVKMTGIHFDLLSELTRSKARFRTGQILRPSFPFTDPHPDIKQGKRDYYDFTDVFMVFLCKMVESTDMRKALICQIKQLKDQAITKGRQKESPLFYEFDQIKNQNCAQLFLNLDEDLDGFVKLQVDAYKIHKYLKMRS
jgi:hypothetical protein